LTVEHRDIPDSGLHEPKGVSNASSGQVYNADGVGSGAWGPATIEGQNTAAAETIPVNDGTGGITWVDTRPSSDNILEADNYNTQNPAGLDIPLQISFGPAQINGILDLDASGGILVQEAGNYFGRLVFRIGRTASTSAALISIRTLVDGIQVGPSISYSVDTADIVTPYSTSIFMGLEVGQLVSFEVVRDGNGADDGGLYAFSPVTPGWNQSPSARITMQRLSF
jgi:hypothetical protein